MSASADINEANSSGMDLVSVFNKIDIDGSGCLSKEELWSHVSSKGRDGGGLSRKDFDVLFAAIDTDKSGSIDFAEYSRFMEDVHKKKADRRKRSVMRISTQRASLTTPYSSTDAAKLQKELRKKPMERRASTSRIGSLAGSLVSTRRQSGFRRSNTLDMGYGEDESMKDESALGETSRSFPSTLRFFDVEVREYGLKASDNPGVGAGVALELSWDYNVLERMHLDTFEEKRSTERSKNFTKEKRLTRIEREQILRDFGATQKEIQEAAKRATLIRNARRKSVGMVKFDKQHLKRENKLDSLKKKFGIRRKSDPAILGGEEFVDLERLHPTLMVMMGLDDEDNYGDEKKVES